ncbi:hypothetical protein A3A66_01480 [Microgenomates group bacterium RIFCSPLOWO2_01_FULL_46_13]|nr:MAG: hypothetical protein A2783_00925 [Microgenomates group bacterium RIFCSPHIGHO2_01_FULL_45_11]OGV94669.1 MAG: hypothetical protein A3A66_01480 [Microgenomates group bacterium RIFCSPLOWO2_01_FULL_46_13]
MLEIRFVDEETVEKCGNCPALSSDVLGKYCQAASWLNMYNLDKAGESLRWQSPVDCPKDIEVVGRWVRSNNA